MLSLNMIVRDEKRGIVQTLESCKHLLDTWDILDTGSTDGTQDLIQETLKDIPGTLHHGPFVDYSTTRNAALDLCQSEWALLLSGDELVTWADRDMLHAFLRSSTHAEHAVTIRFGALKFGHVRLVRPAGSGRYTGVTHEVIIPRNQGKLAPLALRSGRAGEDRTARWQQDRKLLEAELHKGEDPRTLFYLAQTYSCLGMIPEAKATYGRRIAAGVGYHDEFWEAHVRAGAYGDMDRLVEAINMRPHRAEPWFYLGQLMASRECLERAANLPVPKRDTGFIDLSVYGPGGRAREALEALG
jgi:hypothetical protein